VEERAPRFLAHFEALLAANPSESGYFVGDACTVVDLHAWVMLSVTVSQWPEDDLLRSTPLLRRFKAQIEARPRIRKYIQSGRRRAFAGDSLM
jgi:glutathione S-transferase